MNRLEPVPPPPDASAGEDGDRPPVPWSWVDALGVAALTLVLAPLLNQGLVLAFGGELGRALSFPVLLVFLAAVTVTWVHLRHPGQVRRLLGTGRFRLADLGMGVAHGITAFVVINVGFALLMALLAALFGADLPTVQEGLRERAVDREHAPYVLLSIVLVAPVAEELFFRGMLFQPLRDRLGVWPGIGVSSVVFGLAHWETGNLEGSMYAFLVLFAVGMYLAWVFDRRRHLGSTIAMHATFNSVAAAGILAGLA